jgi:2-oxoglutarate ferredoxin oxidoreductase subunit delta
MVKFEEVRCKSCGLCVAFCPKKCLEITSKINSKGYRIAGITDKKRASPVVFVFRFAPMLQLQC